MRRTFARSKIIYPLSSVLLHKGARERHIARSVRRCDIVLCPFHYRPLSVTYCLHSFFLSREHVRVCVSAQKKKSARSTHFSSERNCHTRHVTFIQRKRARVSARELCICTAESDVEATVRVRFTFFSFLLKTTAAFRGEHVTDLSERESFYLRSAELRRAHFYFISEALEPSKNRR